MDTETVVIENKITTERLKIRIDTEESYKLEDRRNDFTKKPSQRQKEMKL